VTGRRFPSAGCAGVIYLLRGLEFRVGRAVRERDTEVVLLRSVFLFPPIPPKGVPMSGEPGNPVAPAAPKPAVRSRLVVLELLQLPSYRYLLVDTICNNIGFEARLMAQAWLVLALSIGTEGVLKAASYLADVAKPIGRVMSLSHGHN
jgi:hypothetical protein